MCTQQLFLLQFMICSYWISVCHPSGSLPVCKTCIVLYVLGQCIIIVLTVTSRWREALKIIYFDWQQWFQPSFLTWNIYIQDALRILDSVVYIIKTSLFLTFWDYKSFTKLRPVSLYNSYPARAILPPLFKAVSQPRFSWSLGFCQTS